MYTLLSKQRDLCDGDLEHVPPEPHCCTLGSLLDRDIHTVGVDSIHCACTQTRNTPKVSVMAIKTAPCSMEFSTKTLALLIKTSTKMLRVPCARLILQATCTFSGAEVIRVPTATQLSTMDLSWPSTTLITDQNSYASIQSVHTIRNPASVRTKQHGGTQP